MKKFLFRISLILALIAIFVYFISRNLGTIERTVHMTASQSLVFILIALVFSALAFLFWILASHQIFRMLGLLRSRWEMFFLRTEAIAMNVIVPVGGVSSWVVFATDAKKRGESEATAIAGVILSLLVDCAAIAVLLIIAIIYLFTINSLGLSVIIPALAFFALTLGLFLLIYLSGKNKVILKRVLEWGKNKLNRIAKFFGRKPIVKSETSVNNFILELENANYFLSKDRKDIYISLCLVLVSHFLYLVAIYVLFYSFGIEPLYRVLISGYAIGMMVTVVSPTSGGVGFAEGSMALAYTSLGVPGGAAAAVTLIYRGFYFWLPLIIGFVTMQRRHLLGLLEQARTKNF